jgi:hypothetical protein
VGRVFQEFRLYRHTETVRCPGTATLHWFSSQTMAQDTDVAMVSIGDD